jgi:hypothetical protein
MISNLEEAMIAARNAVDSRGLKIMLVRGDPFNPQSLVEQIHALTAGVPLSGFGVSAPVHQDEVYFNLAVNVGLLANILKELARHRRLERQRIEP